MERFAGKTIDAYIRRFPLRTQAKLRELRATIQAAAPEAAETINYAIPTLTLKGHNLVHFAAYERHIGFYPTPTGIEAFAKELNAYEGAKGSVRFPLEEPLPLKLVAKIVRFRVAEVLRKEEKKRKAR